MVPPPEGLDESDYDRIEAAVMETARGRWFLAEFARRVRAGDTAKILDAIHRLERASAPAQFEMAQTHVRAIGDRLFDIAYQLRARGVEDELCRAVEREASAACALAGETRGAPFALEFEERPAAPPLARPAASTLAEVDALSIEERLRLCA